MSTLISMQQSPEEAKEQTEPKASDAPKYPWGLCLTLNDDSLEKLGIDKLPEVGSVVTITARAEVSSIRDYQTQGGESEASMDLQITDMQVDGMDANTMGRAAGALYGGK